LGFAFSLVDAGSIDGYLSAIAVDAEHRRQGIARRLVQTVIATSGASRLDLLSEPGPER
jgi:ribosomal protein S18 acetylase RimI-like enzyme